MRYADVKRVIFLGIGGHPSITPGVTRDDRYAQIANMAGRYLYARSWRFRERSPRPLDVTSGVAFVEMPADVGEILEAFYGTERIQMTTPHELEAARVRDSAVQLDVIRPAVLATLDRPQPTPGDPLPATRLQLWPTPQETATGKIRVIYRSRWVELLATTPDEYEIPIPDYALNLFEAYLRAFVQGEEDDQQQERVTNVDRGQLFQLALAQDTGFTEEWGVLPLAGERFRLQGTFLAVGSGIAAPVSAESGIRWRGEWLSEGIYGPGDVVGRDGNAWIAVTSSPGGPPPAGNWELLARKGLDGAGGAGSISLAQGRIAGRYDPGTGTYQPVPVGDGLEMDATSIRVAQSLSDEIDEIGDAIAALDGIFGGLCS